MNRIHRVIKFEDWGYLCDGRGVESRTPELLTGGTWYEGLNINERVKTNILDFH